MIDLVESIRKYPDGFANVYRFKTGEYYQGVWYRNQSAASIAMKRAVYRINVYLKPKS